METMDNAIDCACANDDSPMLKRFFKNISPHPDRIKNNKALGYLGKHLQLASIWYFNRRTIAGAFGIGFFCMWIPFPIQTVIAATVAVWLRCNLPVSVLLVYVTNPITIPPMFYFAYHLGAFILDSQTKDIVFELSFVWLQETLTYIWQPLFLGCTLLAIISSIIGYYGIHVFWRLHILQRIRERRARKKMLD